MHKSKEQFICVRCDYVSLRWHGQCPSCQAWNSLEEKKIFDVNFSKIGKVGNFSSLAKLSSCRRLNDVDLVDVPRFSTGIAEFDRVLGGGVVRGGVVLIGGDPGVGKSTLLLQALANLAITNKVLYVSGEESDTQIAMRAQRLGIYTKLKNKEKSSYLHVFSEIQLEAILSVIEDALPLVAVIDSIQTIYSSQLNSSPGSVAQVRECAACLTRLAKQKNITIIIVGHVTKDGSLAGPRVLEHIVDTVLYFEGDTQSTFRIVRAFKNRFGAVNELGVFAMSERGLLGVTNPSAIFLSRHQNAVPGSCVLITQEGNRPLLVEIQALVDVSHLPNPKRLAIGLEQNRLSLLLAVLHRHAGIACYDQDVFLNAVGGVKITEPAADLAILLAIRSSLCNKALPARLAVFGEVGLAGEIRPCPRGQERLREAEKLGFTQVLMPQSNLSKKLHTGSLEVLPIARISDAIDSISRIG